MGVVCLLDQDNDQTAVPKSIRLRPATWAQEVLGGYAQIEGFEFLISFDTPPVPRIYRPCCITIARVEFPLSSYKTTAFAWPESGHQVMNVVSQVPPNLDYSLPTSPRFAARQGRIVAGS